MIKDVFDEAVNNLVDLELRAIDKLIKEFIEPLSVRENPEKLIGKPLEQWTEQDLQMLTSVYGTKEPNILSNFIFRKKYEQVKELEAEEVNG